MEVEVKTVPKITQSQTHNNPLLIKICKLFVFLLICLGVYLGKTYGTVKKWGIKKKRLQ